MEHLGTAMGGRGRSKHCVGGRFATVGKVCRGGIITILTVGRDTWKEQLFHVASLTVKMVVMPPVYGRDLPAL